MASLPRSSSGPARPVTATDVLGVPLVPPAAVTRASTRLRGRLSRMARNMAPPPVQILEGLFGMLDHRVLVALCRAGVPEALTRPTTPAELAERLDADPAMLERLLRYGATRGWVRIDRRGRVRPSPVTAFLRSDHPGGWRAWVDFAAGDDILAALSLLDAQAPARDAFAAANGAPFFTWIADHPDRWAIFDRAMAAGGRMHALMLAKAFDWPASSRVCDVGGGTGDLLATLLDLHPALRGTVYDLPAVVGRAVSHKRLTAVAGDAFVDVPARFDTYLLVNVLHDWNDDDASRILARVAEAAGPDARIIVVDSEHTQRPRNDLAVATDVLMAALTNGGKERDADAFAALGRACGLRLRRTVRLASGDLAHEFAHNRP
jgi:O-methyltransferase domain